MLILTKVFIVWRRVSQLSVDKLVPVTIINLGSPVYGIDSHFGGKATDNRRSVYETVYRYILAIQC